MPKNVNNNSKKASNLIFLSLVIYIISLFLFGSLSTDIYYWIDLLIPATFFMASAILIRKGYKWAKWVYTIITRYYLFDAIAGAIYILPIAGFVAYIVLAIEYGLRITAIFFLFKPKKSSGTNPIDVTNPLES